MFDLQAASRTARARASACGRKGHDFSRSERVLAPYFAAPPAQRVSSSGATNSRYHYDPDERGSEKNHERSTDLASHERESRQAPECGRDESDFRPAPDAQR